MNRTITVIVQRRDEFQVDRSIKCVGVCKAADLPGPGLAQHAAPRPLSPVGAHVYSQEANVWRKEMTTAKSITRRRFEQRTQNILRWKKRCQRCVCEVRFTVAQKRNCRSGQVRKNRRSNTFNGVNFLKWILIATVVLIPCVPPPCRSHARGRDTECVLCWRVAPIRGGDRRSWSTNWSSSTSTTCCRLAPAAYDENKPLDVRREIVQKTLLRAKRAIIWGLGRLGQVLSTMTFFKNLSNALSNTCSFQVRGAIVLTSTIVCEF